MSFRDNLQHLRGTRDLSQAQLATLLGVSRQSVAKWEAEKSYPEMDKLIKLCDLFEARSTTSCEATHPAARRRARRSWRPSQPPQPRLSIRTATTSTCAAVRGMSLRAWR